MIRFNIIGVGFLDFEEGGGLAFKSENPFFRFADVSLARSVEFSVPATDRNRALLNFAEDVAETGDMIRNIHSAQMVYDGSAKLGTLAVTGYESNAFKCVFYIGNAEWIDRLQELQLADCPTSFTKGVLWSANVTPINANLADPTQECQLLLYDNGLSVQPASWQLVPSVNVKYFIEDVLTNLGVPYNIGVDQDFWMVAGSMKGGTVDSVTFAVTATNTGTVTQNQGYFSPVSFTLGWARRIFFGQNVNGGSTTAIGFQANNNVAITFPSSVPTPLFVVKWSPYLWRCEVLGGETAAGAVYGIEPLPQRTIEITQGDIIFFTSTPFTDTDANGRYFGWKDVLYPLSLGCSVERSDDLAIGETWNLGVNMPDCTLFEFLKSVAVATGNELTVDPTNGITIGAGSYGSDFVALENVISIDSVDRCVDAWGNNTRKASIVFDSEDYVTQHIKTELTIDNENCTEDKETKVFFNEGEPGGDGVVIEDVESDGGSYKFSAKKWTLAYANSTEAYLQRVNVPNPIGYDDIANDSTAVRVKVAAPEADFFNLEPTTTFLWRGSAFVWTSADWSDGVMALTLQRVSDYAI